MMRRTQTLQNPKSKIQNASGQSMLEFAIAFAGLVMFIFVFTRVWTWVNGTMVQRQEAFQRTRLAAGEAASAGIPVPYVPDPIALVGLPNSTGGVPRDPLGPPVPGTLKPPCE